MINANKITNARRWEFAKEINQCRELFMDGLTAVCWYNGLYECVEDMVTIIKETKPYENYCINRPDSIGDPDSLMGILWSILVYNFGSYGTSPRFGWIEVEHLDECIRFLYTLQAFTEHCLHDEIDIGENIECLKKDKDGKYTIKMI